LTTITLSHQHVTNGCFASQFEGCPGTPRRLSPTAPLS